MQKAPVRRNLTFSLLDGSFYSIMVGMGEAYLAALVLALGYSETHAGLIVTVPLLLGSMFQLISPHAVLYIGSYRTWVVIMALMQGLALFPLALTAVFKSAPLSLLFAIASIYWAAGLSTSPAWNAWAHVLVPQRIRKHFFAYRSYITHLFTFVGLAVGGIILSIGEKTHHVLPAFLIIFLCSGVCRLCSAYFLSRQTEPKHIGRELRRLSFKQFFNKIKKESYGRMLIYLFILHFAVHMSAPYFTPYMLSELDYPYWLFTLLTGTLFVSKVLTLFFSRKLFDWVTTGRLIFISSLGISCIPLLWVVSGNPVYIFCIQLFSGVFWGIQELSVFLILFNEIPREDRLSVLSIFNTLSALGIFLGSVIGGYVFNMLGEGLLAYSIVFTSSAVLRLGCITLFPETKSSLSKVKMWLTTRTLSLHPSDSMSRPVISSIETRSKTSHSTPSHK